jgi:hypothetical protein
MNINLKEIADKRYSRKIVEILINNIGDLEMFLLQFFCFVAKQNSGLMTINPKKNCKQNIF